MQVPLERQAGFEYNRRNELGFLEEENSRSVEDLSFPKMGKNDVPFYVLFCNVTLTCPYEEGESTCSPP